MTFSAPSSVPDLASSEPTDKWLLASHMQKAIRRGLTDEAAWAASRLWAVDASYARNRLATIAVEDVATASPQIVADLLPDWTIKGLRANGGGEALATAASQLAAASKDRLACWLWGCRKWLPAFEESFGSWADLAPEKALELAWEPSQTWWVRGLAAWRAVGTAGTGAFWDRSKTLPECAGIPDHWTTVCREHGITETDEAVLTKIGRRQLEPHPLFLPLAWTWRREAEANDQLKICEEEPVFGSPKCGPWLSCAIDMHTRPGRQALNWLLRHNKEGFNFLANHGRTGDAATYAVGHLWFWLEGGWIEHRPQYPILDTIRNDTWYLLVREPVPMPSREFYEAFQNQEEWHQARLAVMPQLSANLVLKSW